MKVAGNMLATFFLCCDIIQMMNKTQFLLSIDKLESVSQLKFFQEGKYVSNRFDMDTIKEDELTDVDKLSLSIYSLIMNLSIFKGKNELDKPFALFEKLLSSFDESYKNNLLNLIKDFMYSRRQILLPELIENLSALAINYSDVKDGLTIYKKQKKIITNEVTLFIRSLFHSILTLDSIKPELIKVDENNLISSMFVYDDKLVAITPLDAYSLVGYKKVAKNIVEKTDVDLDIKTLSILYATKDVIVEIGI